MSLDPVRAVGEGVLSAAELVKAARQVLDARPQRMATDGPREGDRKPGADGELEFRGGHWRKAGSLEDSNKSKAARARRDGAERQPQPPTHESVGELLHDALRNPAKASGMSTELGQVSESSTAMLSPQFGSDVTGFVHSIDGSTILHILGRHGVGIETRPGHVPVYESDIDGIASILSDADHTEPGQPSKGGLPRERFIKRVNGYFLVVEEQRNQAGQLAIVTARKTTFDPSGKELPD